MGEEQFEKTEQVGQTKKKRSFVYRIFKIFVWLVILLVIAYFIFQLPAVQRWTVKKINNQLTSTFQRNTKIDHIDIDIYEGVVLNGFVVLKKNSIDTLLFVSEFSFSLQESLASLITNKLLINEISLKGALVNEYRAKDAPMSDFKDFLVTLSPKKEKDEENTEPYDLAINKINLHNLKYISIDDYKQLETSASLESGRIIINSLDLVDNYYGIEEIILSKPNVMRNSNSSTLVKSDSKETKSEKEDENKTTSFGSIFGDIKLYSSIDKIRISDGNISLNDISGKNKNYNFKNINLSVDSFFLNSEPELSFKLNDFNLKENGHINVNKFSIDKFKLTDRKLLVKGVDFKSDKSNFANTFTLKYRSIDELLEFSDKVFGSISIAPSRIALSEVIYMVPDLEKSLFFKRNKNKVLYFDGIVKGRKNGFNLRDIDLKLGDELSFKGAFSVKNAFKEDENLYNLTIDRLHTSIDDLRSIIPNFTLPKNFEKIRNIDYSGRLDGYLKDFVSYGELNTNLGRAKLDMRLNSPQSLKLAQYSGSIEVIDFDIRTWSGNKDLETISFTAKVKEGRGLELDIAHAILNANISKVKYKEYLYQNVLFNGQINQRKILGKLSIDDDNLAFDFDGNFEIRDSDKLMDFELTVDKMNLKNLNLSKEDMAMSGKITMDLSGNNIEDMLGKAFATRLTLRKGVEVFLFDTVALDIKKLANHKKSINLYSDLIDVALLGEFQMKEIPLLFTHITANNYNRYYELFNLKKGKSPLVKSQNFTFDYEIKDTKKYLSLVGMKDMRIVNAKGAGKVDMDKELIDFHLELPEFKLDKHKFRDININTSIVKNRAVMRISVDSIYLNNKRIDPVEFNIKIQKDTLDWNLIAGHFIESIGIVDIGGKLKPKGNGVDFSFYENKLELFGADWSFSDNNYGYFEKEHLDINKLELTDGKRYIRLNDINNKGIRANISNFEIEPLNSMIKYDNMDFFGVAEVTAKYDNIFHKGNAFVYLDIEDFHINEDDYGVLSSTFSIPYQMPVVGNVHLTDGKLNLLSDIYYNKDADSLNISANGENMRMDIFEHIISNGISDVEGTVNVSARVYGKLDNLILDGSGVVDRFRGKVDYLGTYYHAQNQKFTTSRYYLDLNGLELMDENDNIAYVKGGFDHDFFSKMRINLDINSDNFMVLNTTKEDNPYYYGVGIGDMDVSFRGPLDNTDMTVDIETNSGSKLSLPVNNVQSDFDENFIQFVHIDNGVEVVDTMVKNENFELKGLDLELKLKLTNEAIVSIIFDEQLGDIIRGIGKGNMQIYSRRNGDFNIYGDYTIDDGEYRFTMLKGIISKPFIVSKGSRFVWSGDPINADINISAYYNGLRAPLDAYLQEYISGFSNESLTSDARNKTDIDLAVNLKGSLFKPAISFDLKFPNLTGTLKSFAESKTSDLKRNENLFNLQIASLIISQRFLPGGDNEDRFGSFFDIDSGINTLSEFVTAQFSDMLSGFLDEAFANSEWSDVDIDLGVAKRSSIIPNSSYLPNEIELHVKNKFKFLDERLSVNFGGNYFKDDISANNNLWIGDFKIDYILSREHNLKVRLYFKYDYEAISNVQNRRTKLGLGIVHEYEFGELVKRSLDK